MLNTHGLHMGGIKKASKETVNWDARSCGYVELFYNKKMGFVWAVTQISIGQNSWTRYDDPDVIKIMNTTKHMTMQEIADAIAERMEEEYD